MHIIGHIELNYEMMLNYPSWVRRGKMKRKEEKWSEANKQTDSRIYSWKLEQQGENRLGPILEPIVLAIPNQTNYKYK